MAGLLLFPQEDEYLLKYYGWRSKRPGSFPPIYCSFYMFTFHMELMKRDFYLDDFLSNQADLLY